MGMGKMFRKKGPPSDAQAVSCWRCRGLIEEAAQLQVKPAALRVWRSEIRVRTGWALLLTVGLAALAALGVFGFALATGVDVARVCELASGTFLAVLSLVALVSTWVIWSKALDNLRLLRAEREEARRYTS